MAKPGADHTFPFQPSPHESLMSKVHVTPCTTANGHLEVYGAPPLSVVPSEQLRLQLTSFCHVPPEQVIVEVADGSWAANVLVSWRPFAKKELCRKPGADHTFPFQPSPHESLMSKVHVAPCTTANGPLEVYGAPPMSEVPSEQLRLQLTSFCHVPPEQVIVEDTDQLVEHHCPFSSCELQGTEVHCQSPTALWHCPPPTPPTTLVMGHAAH